MSATEGLPPERRRTLRLLLERARERYETDAACLLLGEGAGLRVVEVSADPAHAAALRAWQPSHAAFAGGAAGAGGAQDLATPRPGEAVPAPGVEPVLAAALPGRAVPGWLALLDAEPGWWRRTDPAPLEALARRADLELELAGSEIDLAANGVELPGPALAGEGDPLTRSIVDSLPGIFYLYDARGRFLGWNREFERVTGYGPEAFMRLQPLDFFAEGDREQVQAGIAATFEQGSAEIEAPMVTRDGRRVPYFFTGRRVEIDGEPCLLGVGIDITARVEAERAVRASEARFRSLVDGAPEVIFTLDAAGRFQSLNPAFETVTGWPRSDWIGRSFDAIVESEDLSRAVQRFRLVLGGGRAAPLEIRIRGREDALPVELRLAALLQDDGDVAVLGTGHDVSERKRLEARTRQTQKLESLGRLAAGVAHDFNNLLMVIQGHASLLRAAEDAVDVVGSAEEIERTVERAAALVRQLLVFGRGQGITRRRADLGEVLTEMGRMLERILGEDIRLEIRREHERVPVQADVGMIEQLVMNLAVNARDAMPDGGTLSLVTERVRVDAGGELPPGTYARLRVADTGAGIAPADLPRVFEPFYTTKAVGQGAGLGLATVYGIATQHGGSVEVDSSPGHGTEFRVLLPLASVAAAEPVSDAAAGEVPERALDVLVVEDETAVLGLVERALVERGHRVRTAASGDAALEVWAAHGAEVDVLLTDLVMPGRVGGVALVEHCRRQRPDLPVVLTSGYTADASVTPLTQEPRVVFLPKPYLSKDLERALARVTAG